jgi:hypothetical protein
LWEIMITALMRMGVARDIVNRHSMPRPDQRNAGGDQLARQRAAIARRHQAVQRRSGGTVYAIRHQAGCTNDVELNPAPWQSARWHTDDGFNGREPCGDTGAYDSTGQSRASAAGYRVTRAQSGP